jgi:ATP-binding cassette subfamily F protein uup
MRREQRREFMFRLPDPPRLSKVILEAEELGAAAGGKELFSGLSFIMQKHMCVGIAGPNGCGKTTLLKTLMGEQEPAEGKVIIGENTDFLYVEQGHEEAGPEENVLQYVTGGAHEVEVNGQKVYVPEYLESFLFDGESIRTPMRNLSGGERNRLDLAKKMLRGGNFLILDEPTNDLDLTTLRVLEETVEAFDGCSMIVSHDRYFLNRLCTHMIVFEEGRGATFIAGDFNDWLRYKERRDEREEPQRTKKETREPARSKPEERRMSWHEKRELESMEDRILAAEEEIETLERRIGEPGFYEQEYTEVRKVIDALDGLRGRLENLYARWQELERIAEEAGFRK